MIASFRITFEQDWRGAPMAFWVHVPVGGSSHLFEPPAPQKVPHKGYAVLRVEFGEYELQFSSLAQLDHSIEVLARKPLPTSRQLSVKRELDVGPNGHWLSRFPSSLKSPKRRFKLVENLISIRKLIVDTNGMQAFSLARMQ